ncbi:hypothetical protein WSS15_16040 [Acetobacter pasteurianus]|uniref:Uncharacterized protein n=1 Tax=Acetobacter pasteurianus TaxID=438 RepID=A0A1A0DLL9_ACEPA|nr:hypothetical protein [Acetobacter pasteurianus]OAZ75910.1 hypothetical protein SRCM100623_00301 [Acetobacter pasteurianus]GLH28954.1 hypothetical protein WSS15_16040 [Acetobacter pasteurianus]
MSQTQQPENASANTNDPRASVKQGMSTPVASEPALTATMQDARQRLEMEKEKEKNSLLRDMRDKELGWCGKFLGSERSAPMTIAALSAGIGCVVLIVSIFFEAICPKDADIWKETISGGITIISTSIAYVFGRGANTEQK